MRMLLFQGLVMAPVFVCLYAACDGSKDASQLDSTTLDICDGPALDEFAATYATTYCEWVFACPDPPDHDRLGCEDLYEHSWETRVDSFLPCRAQDCLDVIASGLTPCEGSGTEWVELEACSYGTVAPATTSG